MVHMMLLFGTLALGGIFLGLFVWAVRGGQFEDPEEAKYLMFREDDESEPGTRVSSGGDADGRRIEKKTE